MVFIHWTCVIPTGRGCITVCTVHIVLIPCMYSNQVILFSSVSFFKCRADKSCTFTSLTPLNDFSPHSLLTFHAPSLPATHPFEFCTLAVCDTLLTVYNLATRFSQHNFNFTNTFRKAFTKFEHFKNLMFHENMHVCLLVYYPTCMAFWHFQDTALQDPLFSDEMGRHSQVGLDSLT